MPFGIHLFVFAAASIGIMSAIVCIYHGQAMALSSASLFITVPGWALSLRNVIRSIQDREAGKQ